MTSLIKKQTDRFRFLNSLYERSNGNCRAVLDMYVIGRDIGLSKDETGIVMQYLHGEGLAAPRTLGGGIAITHSGILEVERACATPESPTDYFPPVMNILNIQTVVGSQIQQGTHSSTQSQTQSITDNGLQEVKSLLAILKKDIADLGLSLDALTEAQAEIRTVEAQLDSPKPKLGILSESLKTLRSLLEGVASNGLAAEMLPRFAPIAAAFGFS